MERHFQPGSALLFLLVFPALAAADFVDVARAPDGQIFLAEADTGRVTVLRDDWVPTGVQYSAPGVTGVAVAGDGRLAIVTGGPTGQLGILHVDAPLPTWMPPEDDNAFVDPQGVAWTPDGEHLLVFDEGGVKVFNRDGAFQFEFGDYAHPQKDTDTGDTAPSPPVTDRLVRPVDGVFLTERGVAIIDHVGMLADATTGRRQPILTFWQTDLANQRADLVRLVTLDAPPVSVATDTVGQRLWLLSERAGAQAMLRYVPTQPTDDHGWTTVPLHYEARHTPPRALAVGPAGDLIVAHEDQVAFLPADVVRRRSESNRPPRRPRFVERTAERIVFEFIPASPEAEDKATVEAWVASPEPLPSGPAPPPLAPEVVRMASDIRPTESWQRVTLAVPPAIRQIALRYQLAEGGYPQATWSTPWLLTPPPGEQQAQHAELPVVAILLTNLVDEPENPHLQPDPADPGPLTDAEVEALQARLAAARRYFWINSHLHLDVRIQYIVDTERYPGWQRGQAVDAATLHPVLERHADALTNAAGVIVLPALRTWNGRERRWELVSDLHAPPAVRAGHRVGVVAATRGSLFPLVGQLAEILAETSAISGFPLELPTTDEPLAGADFDPAVCAHHLRRIPAAVLLGNHDATLRITADQDEDGLPDEDPRVPLDEQRFNSDPAERDTDDDGLADLDELRATYGLVGDPRIAEAQPIPPTFIPNPQLKDADDDGIRDGDDPYPLFPVTPEVRPATIVLDGAVGTAEWPWRGFKRELQDETLRGDVRLARNADHLCLALVQLAGAYRRPAELILALDADADGWTGARDDIHLHLVPGADGVVTIETPGGYWGVRPEQLTAAWSAQRAEYHVELGLPRLLPQGLELAPFERIRVRILVRPEGATHWRWLFEPGQFVELTLR
jgi:hypothetical protein